MTHRIPLFNLSANYFMYQADMRAAFERVMSSGWYILHQEVAAFEAAFAAYCGTLHCVGVGNGLEAIRLILQAYDIGPGDEVIVPSNTFIATWLAVTGVGATVVPVEPRIDTYNLDSEAVAAAITPRTRAIIPVHLYGLPCDMDPLFDLAHRHGLYVIEDGAQAHGAMYKNRRVGNLGDACAFSFFPAKNLGGFGDGGGITTQDQRIAEKLQTLRNYGARVKYQHDEPGGNSRLDELQAAFLSVKLKHLDIEIKRRQELANYYLTHINNPALVLPTYDATQMTHSWHLFVVRTPERERLQVHLSAHHIDTIIHYPIPPHLQKIYSDLGYKKGAFPISEQIHETVLSIPLRSDMTDEEAIRVCEALQCF